MKFRLLFLVFLIPSAEAIELTIPIGTTIFKREVSSIYIEYDRNYFSSIYRAKNNTFDELLIPFKVKADKSISGPYQMTLQTSYHTCDESAIDVTVSIDGTTLQKDDALNNIDFSNSDINTQWTDHEMKFIFPEINSDVKEQQCQGMAGLYVELVI